LQQLAQLAGHLGVQGCEHALALARLELGKHCRAGCRLGFRQQVTPERLGHALHHRARHVWR
jgi:hypothetical protein